MPASAEAPYEGLFFSFTQMTTEIESLCKSSAGFMDPRSSNEVLPLWKQKLTGYQNNTMTAKWTWEIPDTTPVRTIASKGYRRTEKATYKVIGTLSAAWEIQKVVEIGKKKNAPSTHFALIGLASTKVCILDETSGDELARWRFEVGDAGSPGCHFHVQVLGGSVDPPFPKTLDVPRLPGILITPMDAMEFLLGELFQEEWKYEVSKQNQNVSSWAGHQRNRLIKVLGWQMEKLEESRGQSTPWNWLKSRRPEPKILL